MDKFEYLSGLPEVGIVPRAPHDLRPTVGDDEGGS